MHLGDSGDRCISATQVGADTRHLRWSVHSVTQMTSASRWIRWSVRVRSSGDQCTQVTSYIDRFSYSGDQSISMSSSLRWPIHSGEQSISLTQVTQTVRLSVFLNASVTQVAVHRNNSDVQWTHVTSASQWLRWPVYVNDPGGRCTFFLSWAVHLSDSD